MVLLAMVVAVALPGEAAFFRSLDWLVLLFAFFLSSTFFNCYSSDVRPKALSQPANFRLGSDAEILL